MATSPGARNEAPRARNESLSEAFVTLTTPFRRELLAHCYRILGSASEAEDLVQETYINAWRGFDRFEGRSSVRTWLYRIATRACLKALERGDRRALPSGLGAANPDPEGGIGASLPEVTWVEPLPDALFMERPADPAAIVEARQSTRLALVAALQLLPPRQRVVLILRDVLEWRASEVATLLDTTEAAVNSALQRARSMLARTAPAEDDHDLVEPGDPSRRELLDRYVAAFENSDVTALTRLLTEDARWEMPPLAAWFRGREVVGRFLATRFAMYSGFRLVPTMANAQPAFAVYATDEEGLRRAHAIEVLTVTDAGIAHVVHFIGSGQFAAFGMPEVLPPYR
ncbi:sigma-70 family RNA polymerase sigma factor [Actinomadura rudentiformis]|uniref:RNA polymerase sigma factor n=1 Tax=Actinomadura rudentiformis TaxID=359158 RepID=A0A6H9YZD3_9ACTN|nr:sigma-70 family RNA polymerase sigma factor [Actinomadura rudentiformis]KAB2346799.1 sigma-70 family RNA polymerase sigma factor [Actinomadura rudentiformis]